MDTKSVFDQLVAIQSWPTVGLVFALCIIVGYCFKFWPKFPNAAIPALVIIVGATINLLLAGQEPKGVPGMVWHTRQFIVGLIIGFIAWLVHNLIISRIEDWISAQVPGIGKLMNKSSQANTTPPPPVPPVVVLALTALPLVIMLAGCAHFGTKQTDISYEKGSLLPQRSITTKVSATTFLSAKSDLAKFRASQTDKTQSASVGALSQSAEVTTNVTDLLKSVTAGAVEGAIRGAAAASGLKP